MKNGKTGLTAVLLGIAFAATSVAAHASTSAATKPVQHAAGRISAVDTHAQSLTVAVNGKSELLTYTSATAIREDGKTVAPSALAAGEQVKVAFEERSGKNVATSIDIHKTATPASATKSR
jgi:Cu/Ag efflux protein CusF